MYECHSSRRRVEHDDLAIDVVALIIWRHDSDFVDPEVREVVESWIY